MPELGSIQISGIPDIEKIYDVDFQIQPNVHAVAKIKVLFSNENINVEDKCIVSVWDSHAGKKLFCGYLSAIYDDNKDSRTEKIIELTSCSVDFDLKPYKRSFQNAGETYESIFDKIADQVKGGRVLCGNECSEPIGREIYQYEETNWQLIKRLAGSLKIPIYPDTLSEFPGIYIGTSSQSASCINDCLEYSEGASDRYFNTGAYAHGKDISLYRYFRVKTYKNLEVGSLVQFRNLSNRVISKKAYSRKSEIIFEYVLGQTDLAAQKSFVNLKACGAVLKGTVSDVGVETLKVSLDIDKEYKNSVYCDYPYLSITNNMLYCMPEKNTSVYLNLNDPEGSEARVISCSRTNGDKCSDTKDPINKTFMVPSGMTFKMNGGNIDFISSGNAKYIWNLNVIDKDGIKFNTAAPFKLLSNNGDFNIKSKNLNVKSPFDITCSDGAGGDIKISGTIEISGNDVAVKAEGRMKFSPINDAPKEIKLTGMSILKLALKFLLAAAVVALACVVAVALAPATIAAGAVVAGVIGLSVLGGGIYAGVTVYDKWKDDKDKGIHRPGWDYLYMGLDKFCTGAMLTAPTVIEPLAFPLQLVGVAGASATYQIADGALDNVFGGDFYDSDSNIFGTILLDVGCAGLGKALGVGFEKTIKGVFGAISKNLPYLETADSAVIRKYLVENFGKGWVSYWKKFVANTAGERANYQAIKAFLNGKVLGDDVVMSILTNTPADKITDRDAPLKPTDYKEMGKDIYFNFNDQTGDLELVPGN